jgi:hypothetical protein
LKKRKQHTYIWAVNQLGSLPHTIPHESIHGCITHPIWGHVSMERLPMEETVACKTPYLGACFNGETSHGRDSHL